MTILFAITSALQAAHEQAHETDLGQGHCEVSDLTLLPVSVHIQINFQSQEYQSR